MQDRMQSRETWYLSIFQAPRANPIAVLEKQDVMHRFAEFLHQDKEFSALMGQQLEPIRNKRAADGEMDSMDPDNFDIERKQPGFFDRAAKFVTELLQRFLKWVNSSEQN